MDIKTFIVNPLQVNCYVVSDPETRQTAIIDPGMFFDSERKAIHDYIDANGLELRCVLLTHGHFDHAMSAAWVHETYGLAPCVHTADTDLLQHCEEQIRLFLHRSMSVQQPPTVKQLNDGDSVIIGNIELKVIHTPGHTLGGVCFYCPAHNVLFSGDTIFHGSIGRTDLDTGNTQQLIDSIQQHIITLPAETKILPGHGPATSVGTEQHINPYI